MIKNYNEDKLQTMFFLVSYHIRIYKYIYAMLYSAEATFCIIVSYHKPI